MSPRNRLMVLGMWATIGGCGNGTSDVSLDAAALEIVRAQQQAADCGDLLNPVLSVEQVRTALEQQFEMLDETMSLAEFVQQQIDIFNGNAEQHCGSAPAEDEAIE